MSRSERQQRSTSMRDWPPDTRSALPFGDICRGRSWNVGRPRAAPCLLAGLGVAPRSAIDIRGGYVKNRERGAPLLLLSFAI